MYFRLSNSVVAAGAVKSLATNLVKILFCTCQAALPFNPTLSLHYRRMHPYNDAASKNQLQWAAAQLGIVDSMFFEEGKEWGRSRRIISPHLNGHSVAAMLPIMVKVWWFTNDDDVMWRVEIDHAWVSFLSLPSFYLGFRSRNFLVCIAL